MDSTFSRATLGFLLLTTAVTVMAIVALWGIDRFGGGAWWASLLVIVIALVAEISIYMTTLHEPVYDWIKEPKRKAEREEAHKRELEREAARNNSPSLRDTSSG